MGLGMWGLGFRAGTRIIKGRREGGEEVRHPEALNLPDPAFLHPVTKSAADSRGRDSGRRPGTQGANPKP